MEGVEVRSENAVRWSRWLAWTGWVVSAAPVYIVLSSATWKLTSNPWYVREWGRIGWQAPDLPFIASLQLAAIVLFVIPRTAVLGTVLLTGYMGGAIASYVRIGELYPPLVPLSTALLAWLGIYLREPRLRALLPIRRAAVSASLMAGLVLATGTPAAAQWLAQPTAGIPRTADGRPRLDAPAPRTAEGRPDFSGLWVKNSPKYARNIAADLSTDEILPWARAAVAERREDLGRDGMQIRCLPLGPAYATSGDSTGSEMVRIVQTPQLIVMLNPDLTYRQIWMDGRTLEPDPNPSWMGYSVGRWEGDTLVVESYGFHAGTWLDRDGNAHSEKLRLTERYSRPVFGRLDVAVTLTDPETYARPFTVKVDATFAADTEMLEWVCNEGAGKSLTHWVGKASDERKNEVKVAPAILARYVGTYVEQPPYWRAAQLVGSSLPAGRVVQITVENGVLIGDMDGRGKQELIGRSETEFGGLYGLGVEFIEGGAGGLYVKHVSGNYRFARK